MSKRPVLHRILLWCVLCATIGAIYWAYSDSLHGPFIFDDKTAIFGNPSLQHLNWAIWNPPSVNGTTVGGRPLLNATLALDYHLGKFDPFSYHVTNLIIHLLAALVLFGLVGRALETYPYFGFSTRTKPSVDSLLFAGSVALLWGLHPLDTESVTYVVQRAESLAGLFYLLTLYCFVRSSGSPRPKTWLTLSILACMAGATVKETVCTAPFVVVLFDRAFAAGSFAQAWKKRGVYYLCFGFVWVEIMALLMTTGFDRGGSIGYGQSERWWQYALTQFEAITRYVGLSFWPRTLIFNYGAIPTPTLVEILPYLVVTAALVALTVWAVIRKPAVGFVAAAFFIILGPTSSVIPGPSQMIVEHRMYLSLACIVVLLVAAGYALLGRAAFAIAALLACALGIGTYARNAEYASEKALWTTVTERRPQSSQGWSDLAAAYYAEGAFDRAIDACMKAIQTDPKSAAGYYNLGEAYAGAHNLPASAAAYERAIAVRPDFAPAYNNLGIVYLQQQRGDEALRMFQKAVELDTHYQEAVENLAVTLHNRHRAAEAKRWFQRALALNPDSVNGHNGLGDLYLQEGSLAKAQDQYVQSVAIAPDNASVLANLGAIELKLNKPSEAIPHLEHALQIDPNRLDAAMNLGHAFLAAGDYAQSIKAYRIGERLAPQLPGVHYDLANALGVSGDTQGALRELEIVLSLDPNFADAKQKVERIRNAGIGF